MGVFGWWVMAAAACSASAVWAQTTVLYETNFEPYQGYDTTKDLIGQRGWVGTGTGGTGLIDGQFIGFGQQAYVGFSPPSDTNSTATYYPVNFDPAAAGNPLVRFSVKFQVLPSTKGSQDIFRWSIYNIPGNRLFSLELAASTGEIGYVLEDNKSVPTGSSIGFDGYYDLDVWMDFRRNYWSAFLNDYLLINSLPITQNNSALNFGDADALWGYNAIPPGDNFMAFDNYRVTAESLSAIPGFVEAKGVTNGLFNLTAYGEIGVKYAVDVTRDFAQWLTLGQYDNDNPQGTFDFEDSTSKPFDRNFYRLRPVP
jgi:hypothetical protein